MSGVRRVEEGLREYQAWATDPTPRIPWGMPFFDGPTGGGIARSETCMVLAYSGVGKTMLAMNVIRNNPEVPVLFMSLEMSWRQVIGRFTAMEFGISTQHIENDIQANNGYNRFAQHISDKFRFLMCDDTPRITLKNARESFERATEVLGTPPRLVIWDYLERIGGSGMLNKSEKVDAASEAMADWHRDLDCSGIVLHQVGKGDGSGGWQPLSADSGRYGGNPAMDYVVGAYAPRLNPELDQIQFERLEPELYLQLLKSRSGKANPIGQKYRQDPVHMRIEPWVDVQYGSNAYAEQRALTDA